MRNTVSLLLLIFVLHFSYFSVTIGEARNTNTNWEILLPEKEHSFNICSDSDNIYACGVTFEDSSSNKTNGLLLKTNKDGTQQWKRIWEKEEDVVINRVVFDGTYLYTAGFINSEDSREILIIKWDVDGNEVWNKSWVTNQSAFWISSFMYTDVEVFNSLVYHNNHLYICFTVISDSTGDNIQLFCFTTEGTLAWNNTFGPGLDLFARGKSMCVMDNFLYLCGEIEIENTVDSYRSDFLLMKWDLNGNLLWNKTLESQYQGILKDIQPLNQDLVICGNYNNEYTYITRTNSSGEIIWEKIYDKKYWNYPIAMDLDLSHEPEIIIGGSIWRCGMDTDSFLVSYHQNGELNDAGSHNRGDCIDIIKEDETIFACFDNSIASLNGIPPFIPCYLPGFSVGIVFIVSLLITAAVVLTTKKITKSVP